jgi:fibronectin type 3 domain-containing protein
MTNLLNVGIQFRKFSASMMLTGLAALAGLMLSANVSLAQPTLKLRFAFDDGPSGTTTPSDTSGGGADVTLQMITGAGTASTNLHGAANSGVAALTNPNRCLNLSSNGSHGATGNYAGVTNANLGFGSVSSFVATMWMKESKGMSGNTLGRMFLLGNSTNTDVGTANSIGMKWQGPNQLYFFVNTVQCSMSFPQADTNGWIFVAMVYDGSSVVLYEGTDKTSAVALSTNVTAGQIVPLPSTSASLIVGNNLARNRDFAGWIDDFRFYTGTGASAAFVESIRQSAAGPSGLVAVPNDSKVTLTWNALSGAASYNVKRSTTSGGSPPGTYTTISTAGSVTTPSYTDSTAVNGTTYYYTVSAVNGSTVESANSANEASATPSVPPPAPTDLTPTPGNGSVALSWSASTGAATYNVKRSTTSLAEVTITNVTTTTFMDTAVVNGVPYYYVVSAINATGSESANSSEATATPVGPPPAPTGLKAFAAGIGQVGLSWSASLLATSYNVYRATSSGGTYTKISTDGTVTTTSYTDTGASGSTPYFYKVSAVNLQGEGPQSAAASAAPLTAKLRFDFSDAGTTTVDSINSVSLNMVNGSNVATDYHGVVNSGVAGAGKSLDFSSNPYNSPTTGPLASTIMNTTFNSANFGAISNFTLTFWVKPDYDFYTSGNIAATNNPRLFILSPANFVDYPGGIPSTQPGLFMKINSYDASPHTGELKVFLGSGASTTEYVTPENSFVSAPGLWSFVAITYDGSALKVYTATQTNAANAASSLILNAATTGQSLNFTTNGNLLLGNNGALAKSIDAWMADVRFYTGAGDSNCIENIRLLAATPPNGFSATEGSNEVSLNWTAVSGATSYNIKRATSSGGPYTTISTPGSVTGTSYTDSTAVNNSTYYYVFSAVTPFGESANSVQASATASCTPPPTVGNNGPICAGSTLNLTASTVADATYSWTGPNGFTSSDQNPSIADATTAASGAYSVTVTVGACTSAPATTIATVNATPAPTAGNNGPLCEGSTLNLTASTVPGASYSWTGPNGFTSSAQNPLITSATTSASGSYSVTATANGCVSPAGTTTATVNPTPATPTAGSTSPMYAGMTLYLTASTVPSATYSWMGPNGFTSSDQNPSIVNATTSAAGLYSVTATVGTCSSAAGATTVTVDPPVSLSIQSVAGSVILEWPFGTLQSVTNLTDSWSDLTGVISPYTNTSSEPQQFFRVKVQ